MPLAGTVNPVKSGFSGLLGSQIFSAKENASPGNGRSVEAERSIPKTKCALDVEGPGLEVLCLISSWRPQSLPKPQTSKSQDAGSAHSSMNCLRSYIERIERLEAEKSALAADIREIFADAKGNGFDAKIMRQIVRLRKMDHQDRAEQEELLVLYQHAIGME